MTKLCLFLILYYDMLCIITNNDNDKNAKKYKTHFILGAAYQSPYNFC